MQVENKDEILNAIFRYSPDAYILIDIDGKIAFTSEKVEDLSGFTNKELIGKSFHQLISLAELADKKSDKDSIIGSLQKKDGTNFNLPIRLIEVKGSKEKGLAAEKVAILSFQPNGGVDQAQVEFVSTVSHELRTPLTSIKGFADTLLRSREKIPEETKKKYLNIIREQADRLSRLVEDLLAVSRLEVKDNQLTIRSINVAKAIRKVCDSLSSKAANHKLKIEVENDLPDIKADADKLEQVLTNLIDNAIKYSPKNSCVTVTASPLVTNGTMDKIKIDIKDEGIGIKEADIPKIFTKFGRLDHPLTRNTEGTGLGLFITKSLVLALKGDISVTSSESGTTFTVVLPADILNSAIPLASRESNNTGVG